MKQHLTQSFLLANVNSPCNISNPLLITIVLGICYFLVKVNSPETFNVDITVQSNG